MTLEDYIKLDQKRNKGKSAASEHDLQVQCVTWFRWQYPRLVIMAIPNGGYRTATTARLMKAEGQLAGVPDLFVPVPAGEYHGLWIEMKNGKAGRLSPAQKTMHEYLRAQGYAVEVVRDGVHFRSVVTNYIQGTRTPA
jgi:hypothetical protein